MDTKARFNPMRCVKVFGDIVPQDQSFSMVLKFHIFDSTVASKVHELLAGFACALDQQILGVPALLSSTPAQAPVLQEPLHCEGPMFFMVVVWHVSMHTLITFTSKAHRFASKMVDWEHAIKLRMFVS